MNKFSCNCDLPESKKIASLLTTAKILASKTKLKILLILLSREYCVCEIQECLNKEQSLISHHLSDLVEAGWINKRQGNDARQIFYSLTKENKKKLQIFLKIGGVEK